jgi:2'-5' RNA ligase
MNFLPRAASLLAVIFILASSAAAVGVSCPASVVDDKGLGKVPLFSSLSLANTPFAKRWSKARKQLAKEFPHLRFEKPSDLHITLAFMSVSGWDAAKIEEMEKLGLDGPDLSSGPVRMTGTPDLFGPQKQVVAIRMEPVPQEWSKRLMADRQKMTDAGLRPRDRFDDVFTPHVTLATASKPDEQREELTRFQKWMTDRAKKFGDLKIEIDRKIVPRYFLVIGKDETTSFEPLRGYCADAKK